MGHIKEPEGVHLLVEPSLLTGQERKKDKRDNCSFQSNGKKNGFSKNQGHSARTKETYFCKENFKKHRMTLQNEI